MKKGSTWQPANARAADAGCRYGVGKAIDSLVERVREAKPAALVRVVGAGAVGRGDKGPGALSTALPPGAIRPFPRPESSAGGPGSVGAPGGGMGGGGGGAGGRHYVAAGPRQNQQFPPPSPQVSCQWCVS